MRGLSIDPFKVDSAQLFLLILCLASIKCKIMIRFVLPAVMSSLMAISAMGQNCINTTVQIASIFESDGPSWVSLSIQGPDGFWVVEGLEIQFDAEGENWQETFCLWPGCFAAYLTGDVPLNPENFSVTFENNGEPVPFELSFGDATVFVDICIAENDCPDAIDYMNVEGCEGAFEIGSFVEGESVLWDFGDGSEPVEGGHFITHTFPESGVYVVEALYTSSLCPDGVNLTGTVVVEVCESNCELDIEAFTMDGMWYEFQAIGMPEDASYQWYVNNQPIEGATGPIFEMGFDFNPFWWVCVEASSENCPNMAEACYWGMGVEGCPEMLDVLEAQNPCAMLFVFETDGAPGMTIDWYVDGQWVETSSGPGFDWNFGSNGEFSVEAHYQSFTCGSAWYEVVVDIEGCAEEPDCELALETGLIECNSYFFEAYAFPENAMLWWTLDGEPWDNGTNFTTLVLEDNACHEVGVGYETPECPQWVYTDVLVCPEDCGGDCDLSIAAETLEPGIYLFTAVDNVTGEPLEGDLWWTFGNGDEVGNPVVWTWGENPPEITNICVYCSDVPEDVVCMDFQPAAMGCEEVQIILSSDWASQMALVLELSITAELFGFDLNPFVIEGALDLLEGVAGDTLTFCAPPACFELLLDAPNVPIEGLETLVIEALTGDAEAIASLDLLASDWGTFAFGLAKGCLNEVQSSQRGWGLEWSLYPNPSRGGWVQVDAPAKLPDPVDVQIFDALGRPKGSSVRCDLQTPLETAHLAPGTYFLQVRGEDFTGVVLRLIVMR